MLKLEDYENAVDFGFSFADEDEVAATKVETAVQSVAQETQMDTAAKMEALEKLILPLLYNLMKNPEKPYIKWENRVPVIQQQIDKITSITRG